MDVDLTKIINILWSIKLWVGNTFIYECEIPSFPHKKNSFTFFSFFEYNTFSKSIECENNTYYEM